MGVWAPSCVQHGFTDSRTFTDSDFRVPEERGMTASEAIRQFLADPDHAPWLLDETIWPGNSRCSGLSGQIIRNKNLK